MSERPKPRALYVLGALVLLESVALGVATVYLVVEIFLAPVTSIVSAIALAVVAAIAAAGLGYVAWSLFNGRAWARGATVAWQVLQILTAISILIAKSPGVAWALIVPAVVIVVLLFTRTVLAATARRGHEPEEE